MEDFDALPLDTEDALNNISLLIGAARVFGCTKTNQESGINIIEFVDEYIAAVISKQKQEREK